MAPQTYQRILLKASGEALMGQKAFGIDPDICELLARDMKDVSDRGIWVGVVIGGGNIFRGLEVAARVGDRVTGDHLGMLATVMNALALRAACHKIGVDAIVLSALEVDTVCERFSQRRLNNAIARNQIVIFAGGTGNPFFTTDTAAALRAAEAGADVLVKATQVDGIYTGDPRKDAHARRLDRVTHAEILERGLSVMDMAAVAIARENATPIIVYSMLQEGGLSAVLRGEGQHTYVPAS